MADPTPTRPDSRDRTPAHYVTEPQREHTYSELPPGIGMKPDTIVLKHNIFVVSTLTMIITSLITFYIPLFNGLLGGTFGGYHAGRMKRALGAAAVTAVAVPAFLRFLYAFDSPDFLRFFYGLGFWGWTALHVIGTFIGAVAGAASRPVVSGEFLQRAPMSVNAPRAPVPGAAPAYRPTTTAEPETRGAVEAQATPPGEPVRKE